MSEINLRIQDLRKQKGVSQQKLAGALGVSFQTVSKWETKMTMPDISMLPELSQYFGVSVDQLLGLAPLKEEAYQPSKSGTREYWDAKKDYLLSTRKYMWNQDYMEFLIKKVWEIREPVSLLDCGCGWGFLADALLPLLPLGSSYTGIDFAGELIEEAGNIFGERENIRFICGDFFEYNPGIQYDMVISQLVLRHLDRPEEFLDKMISFCRGGGLTVCIDVNREFESDGLYIEGMDYYYLCKNPGFDTM